MRHAKIQSRRGFTLPEIMTAVGISSILFAMVFTMMVMIAKVYKRTEIKNSVSEDYRDLTRRLVEQGNLSNGFFVYPGFAATDRDAPADRLPVGAPGDPTVNASGDLVVFVYFSIKDIGTSANMQGVSRLMGAFRENPGSTASPIRWFDSTLHNWGQTFSAANPAILPADGTGLEALLPPAGFRASCPILANHVLGSAHTASGNTLNLFYNGGKSLYITGFIIRATTGAQNTTSNASVYESQTAFNLTVSPRSQ